jgi:type IV secretory pathway TrbF-like protein
VRFRRPPHAAAAPPPGAAAAPPPASPAIPSAAPSRSPASPAPAPALPAAPRDNPYLAARAEFVSVFLDQAKARRNWQLAAFALLVLLAAVLAAYLRLASQARITPYVVEVDRLGQAVAFGPAEKLEKNEPRLTAYQLAHLLRNLRTVSSDFEAQKRALFTAYAFVSGSAHATLDRYFLDPAHDPRVLGRSVTRQVQVTSVLQLPRTHTWKVAWTETETPRFVGSPRATAWEGYFQVETNPPATTEAILTNPLGLYVTEINWTQLPGDPTR